MLDLIAGILGIAFFLGIAEEKQEKSRKRRETPVTYDVISEEQFEQVVRQEARRFKRIEDVDVRGVCIYCTVRSETGYSTWDFRVDFNDYGKITGSWWSHSENDDSTMPRRLANCIQSRLNAEYL